MTSFWVLLVFLMWTHADAEEKLCLACKNSPSPSHCNKVAKCGSYDRCYMELYMNTLGAIRYDFGCKDEQFCNQLSHSKRQAGHIHVCTHCCNTTMCNFAGCGNNNLPTRNQRGPLCFACDTQNKLDDCAQFKQCNRGEVCVLEQDTTPITGAEAYSSGCMQVTTCENIYQKLNNIFPMVGKRSYDHSIKLENKCLIECCNGDFCNRGCGISDTIRNMTIVYHTAKQSSQQTTKMTPQPTYITTNTASHTSQPPFFFSQTTNSHTTTNKIISSASLSTRFPNIFTPAQTTPVSKISTFGYYNTPVSGCVDDLPNWYCHSQDVLASLCHLKDHAHRCRKSCHLCHPAIG